MKQQLVHMHDQKANQVAMLIRLDKQKTITYIEEFLLMLTVWGLGLLVTIS